MPRYLADMHPLGFYPMSTPETRVGTGFHDQTLAVIYTPRTRGGPGGRDRTLAVKRRKTPKNLLIS